jgi:Ca2+-binding EF-hand superfamily protein
VVVQPTDEQILEFKKTFNLFDNERDGCIPTNVEFQVNTNEVDVGIIGYLIKSFDWIAENFKKFDEDHNNLISVDEFRPFATKFNNHGKMTVEAANNIFSFYDINDDGQLDLDEFINMMILMIKGRDKLCGVNCNSNDDGSIKTTTKI